MRLLFLLFFVTVTPDLLLAAFAFDAATDDVTITDNAAVTRPDGDWAIFCRFKLASNAGTGTSGIFGGGVINSNSSINIYVREASNATDPNDIYCLPRDAGGDNSVVETISTPGTSTAWQTVICQRSGGGATAATHTLYVNGAQDGQLTNNAIDAIDPAVWCLGSTETSGACNANGIENGMVGECAGWDRALTVGEISALEKFSAGCVRDFTWWMPNVREYQEVSVPLSLTNSGTMISDSPPYIQCD